MKRALVLVLLWLGMGAMWTQVALADAGVTVSPTIQDLTLRQGQAQTGFNYSVTNNDPQQTKTFNLSAADFGSLDESGGVAFLGSGAGDLAQHKYGLTNWMQIEPSQVTLAPKQTVLVKVTIRNWDTLAPGGHYGAVLLSQAASRPTGSSQHVAVQTVISTLVFVAKLGGETYGLKLDRVDIARGWWQPLSLHLRFYNAGNIDEVPRGVVRLIDPLGREVARGAINEGSARILPETYRSFTQSLISGHHLALPGRYSLSVQYRYDGQANFTLFTQTLWYFNFWGVVLLLVTVGLVLASAVIIIAFVRSWKRRS